VYIDATQLGLSRDRREREGSELPGLGWGFGLGQRKELSTP